MCATIDLLKSVVSTHRHGFLGFGLLFLGVFALLTLLMSQGRLVATDFDLTVKIQDRIPQRALNELGYLVDLGSVEVSSLILVVTMFFVNIPKRAKLSLLVLYIAGMGVVMGGKMVLHHPAPPYMFHKESAGLHFPSSYVQVQNSYPSGHTYRSVFVATVLSLYLLTSTKGTVSRSFSILPLGVAVGIGLGLIVLGKHWTSDVIGGATLACGLGILGLVFWTSRKS